MEPLLESILTDESITFEITDEGTKVKIGDYTFTTASIYLSKFIQIKYFDDNYVVLEHLGSVIVIHRILKQFVEAELNVRAIYGIYYVGNKLIVCKYKFNTGLYHCEIYDLKLKLLTADKSTILGIFNYKDKVFCITNERKIAEVSVDENNNLEFNDIDDIQDSLYVRSNDTFKLVEIDLSIYSLKSSGYIYVKMDGSSSYYSNEYFCNGSWNCYKINYMTGDFVYTVRWNDGLATYTKINLNTHEQEIICKISDKFHFINRNELTTPSMLKFSD